MKKLVTKTQMEEYSRTDSAEFAVDGDTILTPSAKDLARNKGIKLVYLRTGECGGSTQACSNRPSAQTEAFEAIEKNACANDDACCDDRGLDRETVVKAVIEVLNEKGLLDRTIK